MVYKPVGVDEQGKFPTRVQTALNAAYASKADAALTGKPTLNGVDLATTEDAFINSIIFGG